MARGRSTKAAGFRWTRGGNNDRGSEGLNESHLGGNPGANLKSISHRCYHREVAFEWELTKETIYLSLGCLRGGGVWVKGHRDHPAVTVQATRKNPERECEYVRE